MKVVIRDDILHIEEGLLFKRRTDIPLAKITSITSSGILAKTWTVAGAGTVKIIRGRSHDAVMKLALQKQPSQMQRDVITQKEVVKIRIPQ